MGAKGQNFYTRLAERYGYAEAAATIQDLYLGGKKNEAIAAVPDALVDEVALVGDRARIADRVAAFRERRDDARAAGAPAGGAPAPRRPRVTAHAVEIEGLRVVRGGRTVLDGLSRSPPGIVTGLLGPSGAARRRCCGRSSASRSSPGLRSRARRARGPPELRARVAYATQAASVYDDLSVRENLRYFAAVLGAPAGDVDARRRARWGSRPTPTRSSAASRAASGRAPRWRSPCSALRS